VPLAATRIYQLSFFTGCSVSFLIYVALNKLFPRAQPTEAEAEEPFDPRSEREVPRHSSEDSDVPEKSSISKVPV